MRGELISMETGGQAVALPFIGIAWLPHVPWTTSQSFQPRTRVLGASAFGKSFPARFYIVQHSKLTQYVGDARLHGKMSSVGLRDA